MNKPDMVNHPPHYTSGGIECIEALQAVLTPEEFKGFLKGNVVKYLWRARLKGSESQDAKKAKWYLDRLNSLDKESGREGTVPAETQGVVPPPRAAYPEV